MFFEKKVDLRSRAAMVSFLTGHNRYSTMNSWNRVTSYSNTVKLYNLGLTNAQTDKAYELMSADDNYWHQLEHVIDEFTDANNGFYTIGGNGRSGGYLVLYHSRYESTGHFVALPQLRTAQFQKSVDSGKYGRRHYHGRGVEERWLLDC